MFPPIVSTITQRAYNIPLTFHRFVLHFNHERLRLKCIELKRIRFEEYLARIRQDISDKVSANVRILVNNSLVGALYNDSDYDDGWLKRSDSD